MQLIYVWMEKFRNIEKCGFKLYDNFVVNVNSLDEITVDSKIIPTVTVNITKKNEMINIYGSKINNITAIVGKNSTGKSNFLTCVGDLISSFDKSSFILIYYDEENNKYYFECNQISIKDVKGRIITALHEKYKPKTLILEITENGEYKIIKKLKDIEFITIKDKINEIMAPRANSLYSTIGRYGLSYEDSGVLYQLDYLLDDKNYDSENYKKNNNITIDFELQKQWNEYDNYVIKILPEQFLNEVYYFDKRFDYERSDYQKVYMLRFFEVAINKARNIENEAVQNIVINPINQLKQVIASCNGDINELLQQYNEIKRLIIGIRTELMNANYENPIDIELCYTKFIDLLEKIINNANCMSFMNSYKVSINIIELSKYKELNEYIHEFFQMIDSEDDIRSEFINKKIKIKYSNLSDGLNERFDLFSTIYTCIKRNNIENCKNIILLLDEPDIHMHPEWSRNLLKDVIKYLNDNFNLVKFQIIFSTHSPFMLSDVIKDNIIYLDKDDEGKAVIKKNTINTFGANIHALLKHSFFMDFTIGQLSKEIINDVIKFLNDKHNEYEGNMTQKKARYICSNIGEPLIKIKLMELYRSKYKENVNSIDEKILYYQNEIEELNMEVSNEGIDKNKLESMRTSLKNTYEAIEKILNKDGDNND